MMQKQETKELRRFGFLVGGTVVLLFGIIFPLLKDRPRPLWPWGISFPLFLFAMILPSGLKPLHRLWMGLAGILQWINTRILLTLLFFGVVTPLGMIRRLLGKDTIPKKFEESRATYRVPSEGTRKENFERTY